MGIDKLDLGKLGDLAKIAKDQLGDNPIVKELESKGLAALGNLGKSEDLAKMLAEFGKYVGTKADSPEVQKIVKGVQDYITKNFFKCPNEVFLKVGELAASGGDITKKIEKLGGKGTADFAKKAIEAFCKK